MAGVTFDWEGEICVVTGGGSGIGRALCNALAASGARAVVALDFDLASAEETVAQLPPPPFGGDFKAAAMYADCGKEADLKACIENIEQDIGPIGMFVGNAGIGGGPPGIGVSNEAWDLIQGVNVMQHIYVSRYLIPRMIARGGGSIVITASAAGLLTQVGSMSYAITKAAAVACAEWLSITHGADGLAVSVLCPQAVATNLLETSTKMQATLRADPTKSVTTAAGEEAAAAPKKEKRSPSSSDDMGGGVAGGDGVLTAEATASEVLRCVAAGEFLILPHAEVRTYMERKATDTDRWITGMRRLNESFGKQAVDEARRMAQPYASKL